MSELKDIVPPLELCKRIPAGAFEDSALVWTVHGVRSVEELSRLEFCKDLPIRKMTFPAPTLAEIFRVLPETIDTPEDEFCVLSLMPSRDDDEEDMFWIGYNNTNGKDANPATAALRLWLAMREEEEQP